MRLAYNDLKVGIIFVKDGEPFKVLEYSFLQKQQRKPVVQLKIKNLITGKVQDFTVHQNESFEEAEIEIIPVTFIYHHRGQYWFKEINKPSNRFYLNEEILGENIKYLKPEMEVKALKFKEKIINIELPIKVDLKVIEAPPGIKGDTAQGGTKIVTLETGAKIAVPLFINEGDIIKVNTETGEYIERVSKA